MKKTETKKKYSEIISLNTEIDEFIKYIGLDEKLQELRMLDLWKECVGETIAKYSVPFEFKRGKLVIKVENAVWRYELSLKKEEILKKLQVLVKNNNKIKSIKSIVFI